ncbi:MAG: DUF2975 domain-containing protein [Vallitaleaceae bacterium]|nr:DUF2975 domain-containing protein [Vallitaleaceae bacterium]
MKLEILFLKIVVFLAAIPVLGMCVYVFPEIAEFFAELNPTLDYLQFPFLMGFYATAVAFFFALFQTFKLLMLIDKNQAFSESSAKALTMIKYSAITIGALYVLFMPLIYLMAEVDDAPGMILIGMAIIMGCITVAVFADVLKKLVKNNLGVKS